MKECWVCFPDLKMESQGRLAEARLTLGSYTQPLWGWCEAGRSGERWRQVRRGFRVKDAMRRDLHHSMKRVIHWVRFMAGMNGILTLQLLP